MKPTLLILAAGMGSRYGGLKQLDSFGPSGEAIIDYSIYDAVRAGFGKVVFVIREGFSESFKAAFEPKLAGRIETAYVYQELDRIPEGFKAHPERVKPWGTGHAVLMAADVIDSPFAIINADDFYGRQAFEALASHMTSGSPSNEYCMVGYRLAGTLSENGSVSRGVCVTDESGYLTDITERTDIRRENGGIFFHEDGKSFPLTGNENVSMNCWAFQPDFFGYLSEGFQDFLKRRGTELKSEYFFPFEVSDRLQRGQIKVRVLPTESEWFGVTYPEDRPGVEKSLAGLIRRGEYPVSLWAS